MLKVILNDIHIGFLWVRVACGLQFWDYQAKADENRQRKGGGHKIGKMGRRRLWMAPNRMWFFKLFPGGFPALIN